MKDHLNILPNWPHLISNALKCVGGWGSARDPAGGAYDAPPRLPNRKRQRAFGARPSLFRVHFYISISLAGPSLTEFLDPPLNRTMALLARNCMAVFRLIRKIKCKRKIRNVQKPFLEKLNYRREY